jgi:hypothetical protein
MPINIYQSQVRPTETTVAAPSTPGMQADMGIENQLDHSMQKFATAIVDTGVQIEKRYSQNEVQPLKEKILMGDPENGVDGLNKLKEQAANMGDPVAAQKYYDEGYRKIISTLPDSFTHIYSKSILQSEIAKQRLTDISYVGEQSAKNFIRDSKNYDNNETVTWNNTAVNGATEFERKVAEDNIDKKFLSNDFWNLHGKDGNRIVAETYSQREEYAARRDIRGAQTAEDIQNALNKANKSGLLTPQKYDELVSFSQSHMGTVKADSENKLGNVKKALDDNFIAPDQNQINLIKNTARMANDATLMTKVTTLEKDAEIIARLKTLNRDQINGIMFDAQTKMANEAKTGTPGEQSRIYEVVSNFKDKVEKSLDKDPVSTASKLGTFVVTNLEVQKFTENAGENKPVFVEQLKARLPQAQAIGKFYNVEAKPFTESEAKQISDYLTNTKNPRNVQNVLSAISEGLGSGASAGFKQISKDNKNLGFIGSLSISTSNPNIIQEILQGRELLKDKNLNDLFKEKSDIGYRQFVRDVSSAFPNNIETLDNALTTARYIYIARNFNQQKDSSVFDEKEFKQIFNEAIGGSKPTGTIFKDSFGGLDNSFNGSATPIPHWLKNGRLSDVVDDLKKDPALFAKATGLDMPVDINGKEVNPFKTGGSLNLLKPNLIVVGEGRYAVTMFGRPGAVDNPGYLYSSKNFNGSAPAYFIIDINNIKQEITKRYK